MKTTIENLRAQIREAAQSDARFNIPAKTGFPGNPWVEDIVPPATVDEKWRAIITAANGKTFEVEFTLDNAGKLLLGQDATEVVRKVDYAKAMRSVTKPVTTAPVTAAKPPVITDLPLRCRDSADLPGTSDRVMFLPAGVHTISACLGDAAATITVIVDKNTADVLNASLAQINALHSPQRAFFDKNHEGREATGWPVSFEWSNTPQPGVYAVAEWSALGRELIDGRVMRAFSPSFFTDANLPKNPRAGQRVAVVAGKRGSEENPARVTGLGFPDAGTLTNDPAFRKILPLWAKNAGASGVK